MARTELRANSHQSRVNWWRTTLRRQREGNLSVAEFCRRLGVAVSTFYYWKNRVYEVPSDVPVGRCRMRLPLASDEPGRWQHIRQFRAGVDPRAQRGHATGDRADQRLRTTAQGSVDPSLLHAAITAAGQPRRLPPRSQLMFPQLPAAVRVFLCTKPTDMRRKSFDGLVGMVQA